MTVNGGKLTKGQTYQNNEASTLCRKRAFSFFFLYLFWFEILSNILIFFLSNYPSYISWYGTGMLSSGMTALTLFSTKKCPKIPTVFSKTPSIFVPCLGQTKKIRTFLFYTIVSFLETGKRLRARIAEYCISRIYIFNSDNRATTPCLGEVQTLFRTDLLHTSRIL